MNQNSTILLVNKRIPGGAKDCVMPAVQAMDTPEFFCFDVKTTNSRIKVCTRRMHILSIQSKVCFQDNAMHPTFFQQRVRHNTPEVHKIWGLLKRKSTNDYERSVFHHI